MTLIEALNKQFEDKYSNLKLFDVVYDRGLGVCSVTLLYPCDADELTDAQKEEISGFVKEFLSLNAKVRVKYKKSFLDDNLLIKEIKNYFEIEHISVFPYIMETNINIIRENLDVKIDISLNSDIYSLLDETAMKKGLKQFLDKRFIANFEIGLHESGELLPADIEYEDVIISSPRTPRYNVNIIKKIFGGDIIPRPEYIENVNKPKQSVILAGIITNKKMKTFTIKKGKRKGEEKKLYTFDLTDEHKIECVYFCPKSNEVKMEALQDGMMVLCTGDVQKGLSGNLTYYIRKMTYASAAPQLKTEIPVDPNLNHTQVVFPEPLYSSSQAKLFDDKPDYSDFIMSNTIVVFDIETTGLDPESCEITELGAVKIVNGQVKEKFQTFVKPQKPIPPEVTELTHITNAMVAHAPSIDDVIVDFYNYTRGCIISGHNVIGFDMKFIKKAGAARGLNFDNNMIDTLVVSRTAGLRLPNYKLGTVAKALGISLEGAHRAYNDAYATGMVLLKLSPAKRA